MDTLGAMRTFRQVVASNGFAAAGRHLGRATSSVSRQIAELEGTLGTRLFNRTTRSLSLTEAGEVYHDRVVAILSDVDDANLAIAHLDGQPIGVLRVAVPTSMGQQILVSVMSGFLARYPGIRVVFNISDSVVDVFETRTDVAIRNGRLDDSSLIARKIGDSPRAICASSDYLERAGTPLRPEDLRDHNCLTFRSHPGHNTWSFAGPTGVIDVPVTGNLFINSATALTAAAIAGLGIVLLPALWTINGALKSGQLRQVLPGHQVVPSTTPTYAIYPPTPHVPPKVRAFIDYLTDNPITGAAAAPVNRP